MISDRHLEGQRKTKVDGIRHDMRDLILVCRHRQTLSPPQMGEGITALCPTHDPHIEHDAPWQAAPLRMPRGAVPITQIHA
jgi:hypothetical protein